MMMLMIIMIVRITAIMIMMIKIILTIAVVIIINSQYETGDFSTESTTDHYACFKLCRLNYSTTKKNYWIMTHCIYALKFIDSSIRFIHAEYAMYLLLLDLCLFYWLYYITVRFF